MQIPAVRTGSARRRNHALWVPIAKQHPAGLFHREPGSSRTCTKQIRVFILTRTQQICIWIGTVLG